MRYHSSQLLFVSTRKFNIKRVYLRGVNHNETNLTGAHQLFQEITTVVIATTFLAARRHERSPPPRLHDNSHVYARHRSRGHRLGKHPPLPPAAPFRRSCGNVQSSATEEQDPLLAADSEGQCSVCKTTRNKTKTEEMRRSAQPAAPLHHFI